MLQTLLNDWLRRTDATSLYGQQDLADRVWSALFRVLEKGTVTQDLALHNSSLKVVTTSEFGALVLDEIAKR